MVRPKRAVEVSPYLQDSSAAVQARSIRPHALNVLINNLTYYELESIAYLRETSVSEVVRLAIARSFIDLQERQPEFSESVLSGAKQRLEEAVEREEWRSQVRQQYGQTGPS